MPLTVSTPFSPPSAPFPLVQDSLFISASFDNISLLQALVIFTALYLNRRHPNWLYGPLARTLLPAKRFFLYVSSPRAYERQIIITKTDFIDFTIITTLLVRLCLPQSTTFLAKPCRPLSIPVPQCQDLYYAPITYAVTLWLVIGLVAAMELGLALLRAGFPKTRVHVSAQIFNQNIWRISSSAFCCYEAYSMPTTRFPGSGKILFSPIHFGMKSLTIALLSCVIFYIILALQKLAASIGLSLKGRMIMGCITLPSLAPSICNVTRVASDAETGIRKTNKSAGLRIKPKRPPLTPQTFEPPDRPGSQEIESVDSPVRTPPQDLKYNRSDEEIDPPDRSFRPRSRLGFHADDMPRWSSSRVLDDDVEIEGCAAGLYRRAYGAQPRTWSHPPLSISTAISANTAHKMILPLTPTSIVTVTPPSSPKKRSITSDSSRSENSASSDSDEVESQPTSSPLSTQNPAYDWAKAATFLNELSTCDEEEEVVKEPKRKLAQRPSLVTIDELTDQE